MRGSEHRIPRRLVRANEPFKVTSTKRSPPVISSNCPRLLSPRRTQISQFGGRVRRGERVCALILFLSLIVWRFCQQWGYCWVIDACCSPVEQPGSPFFLIQRPQNRCGSGCWGGWQQILDGNPHIASGKTAPIGRQHNWCCSIKCLWPDHTDIGAA